MRWVAERCVVARCVVVRCVVVRCVDERWVAVRCVDDAVLAVVPATSVVTPATTHADKNPMAPARDVRIMRSVCPTNCELFDVSASVSGAELGRFA